MSDSATMSMILMGGLMAGPAVSLLFFDHGAGRTTHGLHRDSRKEVRAGGSREHQDAHRNC